MTLNTHSFIPDEDKPIPFKLEVLTPRSGYADSEAHRHGFYEIFIFEKGGGMHSIDFHQLPIQDCSVHFISPGQIHQLLRGPESTGFVITFTEEFFYFNSQNKNLLFDLPFFHNKTTDPTMALKPSVFEEILNLAKDILRVYSSSHPYSLNILQSYLHILLLRCCAEYDELSVIRKPAEVASWNLVQAFRKLLEKHFMEDHLVVQYAERLHVTPTYLNSIVKEVTGKNASDVIKERIVLEAKRLLLFSGATAKEIAYSMHFEDPSHFSRFFKNHTGQAPNEFVKENSI